MRRAPLALLTLSAVYVGVWAAIGPRSFYDSFPGLHRVWVAVDGPYNEHLVRDVGGLYLALAVAGVVVLLWPERTTLLALGGGWTVFGTSHLVYHLHHLGELETIDAVGNVVALGATLALALVVLLGGLRGPSSGR